jgi:glycosyltransferase involved in cell wall biosynthesis
MKSKPPKLLFFIAEDWYFWTHRLPLAIAARERGYDVVLVTRVDTLGDRIAELGIRVIHVPLRRAGMRLGQEASLLLRLMRIYRRERPDIVHHVAMKPVIYGSLAARLTGVPHVVNALAGLGFAFTSDTFRAALLRPLLRSMLRRILDRRNCVLIVQNPDDFSHVVDDRLISAKHIRLIRGSGVDTMRFHPTPEPQGTPIVMLPARMLVDKGVVEFVAAARSLKLRGFSCRCVLVGDTDMENPSALAIEQLQAWVAEGYVEWWGHREDMPEALSSANIICLPSYREGLPKVLLEAAACGRAIVTTDVPGCREVVQHERTGLLVPARDPHGLSDAIGLLLNNPDKRSEYARAARAEAEDEFSVGAVIEQTVRLYEDLVKNGKPAHKVDERKVA